VLYRQPGREDIISVVRGMYRKDGLSVLARGGRCEGELTYVSYCKLLVKFLKMHVSLLKLNSSCVCVE